jgi:predicted RecA/RadA family phage recombinase
LWLINPETNENGIFKFPKIKTDGTITGEYWAEKLASEIGKLIDLKCADVDMGTYNRKNWLYELQYNER